MAAESGSRRLRIPPREEMTTWLATALERMMWHEPLVLFRTLAHGADLLNGLGLFVGAGLASAQETALTVGVGFSAFDEWREMFNLGVAPAGVHVAELASNHG